MFLMFTDNKNKRLKFSDSLRENKFISHWSVCIGERGTLGVSCVTLDKQQGNHFHQVPPHSSIYLTARHILWECGDSKEKEDKKVLVQDFEWALHRVFGILQGVFFQKVPP